jgi:hypothetical protein
MSRWGGKKGKEEIVKFIQDMLGIDKVPEMSETGTQAIVKTQEKTSQVLKQKGKTIEESINKKLLDDLARGDLPEDIFPTSFENYKKSLWFKVDKEEDIISVIEILGKYYKKSFLSARRGDKKGVLKDKVVKELADELNLSIDDLLKSPVGKAFNAEEIVGAVELLKAFRGSMTTAVKRAASSEAGSREKAFAMQMVQTYAAMTAKMMGARAEIGRSFRLLKTYKNSLNELGDEDKAIKAIWDRTDGKDLTEQKLEAIYGILQANPKMAAKGVRELNFAKTRDMVFQIYYNNLLNGMTTQMVNLGGGLIYQQFWHAARITGGAWNDAGRMVKSDYAQGGSSLRSSVAAYYGYMASIQDGLRVFGSSFLTGKSIDTFSKIPYSGAEGAITTRNLAYNFGPKSIRERLEKNPEYLADNVYFNAVDGILDFSTRAAPRFMKSADDFMKYIFYRSQLHEYAFLKVQKEVAEGVIPESAKGTRMAEILRNPTKQLPEVRLTSMEHAHETVLQRPLDEPAAQVNKFLRGTGGSFGGQLVAKSILPFFNTLYNLLKVGIESTPVLNLAWAANKNTRLGKMIRSDDPVQVSMARGQLLTAYALVWGSYELAANGYSKGGDPINMRKKQAHNFQIHRHGPSDYSVTIPWSQADPDGKYLGSLHEGKDITYKVDKLDPAGIWLQQGYGIAQLMETDAELDDISVALINTTMRLGEKIAIDSSFATGIADLVEIMSKSTDKPENMADNFARWGARTLTNFIPLKGRFGANLEKHFDRDEDGNLVSRSGNLPNIFETKDENGAPVVFIDNGLGGYDVVNKNDPSAESKNMDIFMNELDNENKRRTDRKGLPRTLNFWGEPAITGKPVGGDWAVTFSPVQSMDQPYNREDLTRLGLFSDEDLEKTQPLMFGNERANTIANSRDINSHSLMKTFVNTVGVFGELERLGWAPRRHPNYISVQNIRIPLSSEQYNDYISMINGKFSSVLGDDYLNLAAGEVSGDYYNFMSSDRNLRKDLKTLMTSERYFLIGNDDTETNVLNSRVHGSHMIADVISFARHGNRESQVNSLGAEMRPITLDGPEKLLLLKYPDLREKVQYVEDTANKKDVKPYKNLLEQMGAE